jgi:hypothetical protein
VTNQTINDIVSKCARATNSRMTHDGDRIDEWGDTIHRIWVHFSDMNDNYNHIDKWLRQNLQGYVHTYSGTNFILLRRSVEETPPDFADTEIMWPEIDDWIELP